MQLEGGGTVKVTRSVNDTKYPMGCKMRRSTFPIQLAYAQVRGAACAAAGKGQQLPVRTEPRIPELPLPAHDGG